jgi:hypothetical protein
MPFSPPLPIRKWLLPNKIIVIGLGTKLHLVEVMPLLAHPLFISLNWVHTKFEDDQLQLASW